VRLTVQQPGKSKIDLPVNLIDLAAGICRLTVVWPVGREERNFDASDYFECLRSFRRILEPEGFRVLCQGARPNVWPSGMSRQAGAWKSYCHRFGQPANMADVVDTFDPVEDVTSVGTLAEQEEWMARHWEAFSKGPND
jgi:hypothetical protein